MLSIKCTGIVLTSILCLSGLCQGDGEVKVSVISSLERVLQNEVEVKGGRQAELYCAKGESESFQIIVANRTDSIVPDVDLQAGDWKYIGEEPAGVPVLEIFREHYVRIERSSPRARSKPGMYPDALIPFVNPYTGERITKAKYLAAGQNVAPGESQGYWVDIKVGREVKAGLYTSEVVVSSADGKIAEVPVTLMVWDFELPDNFKLKTYVSLIRDISSYHHVSRNSPEYKTIERRYWLMLRDHGLRCRLDDPQTDPVSGEVVFSPEYVERLRRYTEEVQPSVTVVRILFSDNPLKRRNYLLSWGAFLRQNRWVAQPIAYRDEPSTREDYAGIIEYSKALHTYAPSVKFLVTEQVKPDRSDYPSLVGSVDIWVPAWYRADRGDIKKRQEAGDEVWSYIHGDQVGLPCWLIDFPILNYRIPAWFSWSLDLKGFLYWQAVAWAGDRNIDPWIDCHTYPKAKFDCGEGSLVYPGYDAGITGPVASMRLKVFRDSMEDFDYFWIASELIGRDAATEVVSPVAAGFKVYSKNANDYTRARKTIAQMILDKTRK